MSNADVNLDELQLDLKNPRFDGLDNQREALQKIVQSQGSKLVNLGKVCTKRLHLCLPFAEAQS